MRGSPVSARRRPHWLTERRLFIVNNPFEQVHPYGIELNPKWKPLRMLVNLGVGREGSVLEPSFRGPSL
jgi:hypothetical protein